MEYVEGSTLEERIGPDGLAIQVALQYAIQIADALAAAHTAGIVHRDLKPSKVMVIGEGARLGELKVLDFGLAKVQDTRGAESNSSSLGPPGVIAGTVAYMSPEQAEGKSVDSRSDLFSFGSVLYEMLTGRKPFRGGSQLSTLSSILRDTPPPLKSVRPDVPVELERILALCLEKDRSARYQSAAELHRDLTACLARVAAFRAGFRGVLRRPRMAIAALLVLILGLAAAAWGGHRIYRYHWVRTVALPEITRLADKELSIAAFRLAREIDRYAADEPELQRLRRDIWVPISIDTEPPGADVLIQPETFA